MPQYTPNLTTTKQPLLTREPPVIFCKNPKSMIKSKCKNKIKCVIVGDKAVGKTALAVAYCNDTFPQEYVPTAYDNYNVVVQVDGKPITLEVCDTAGEDEFTPLRSLCYPGTDIFILCFSVVKPSTFHSACTRWADELTRLDAAVVLVGTQCDLRENSKTLNNLRQRKQHPVIPSDVKDLSERLNAPYVETSAKNSYHLKQAFDLAITLALRKHRTRKWWKRLCCI